MFEYEIEHIYCGERTFIWGGSWRDACEKWKIDEKLWNCIFCERIED